MQLINFLKWRVWAWFCSITLHSIYIDLLWKQGYNTPKENEGLSYEIPQPIAAPSLLGYSPELTCALKSNWEICEFTI